MNSEECLICKGPLEYLIQDQLMECAVCHRKELSKTRCVNGHYVCSDCHTQGMDSIFGLCLSETSADPVAIVRRMMDLPFCHMHGPEHHVMVGAALLTAYKNAGFIDKLHEMGIKVSLWTVDTEDSVRSLLRTSADAYITNRPDRVREWMEKEQAATAPTESAPTAEADTGTAAAE